MVQLRDRSKLKRPLRRSDDDPAEGPAQVRRRLSYGEAQSWDATPGTWPESGGETGVSPEAGTARPRAKSGGVGSRRESEAPGAQRKSSATRRRPRQRSSVGLGVFEDLFRRPRWASSVLQMWAERLDNDPDAAVADAVELVIQSARGAPPDAERTAIFTAETVRDDDGTSAAAVDAAADHVNRSDDPTLLRRVQRHKAFRAGYIDFWRRLARTCGPAAFESGAVDVLAGWLARLSGARSVRLRLASSLANYSLVDGLNEAAAATGEATAAVDGARLAAVARRVFSDVLAVRSRDTSPELRAMAATSLAKWARENPEAFAGAAQFKHLGWLLSDRVGAVRSAAVAGLGRLCEDAERVRASGFFEDALRRLCPRIVEMRMDKDLDVAERAVRLGTALRKLGLLSAEQVEAISATVLEAVDGALRNAVADFVVNCAHDAAGPDPDGAEPGSGTLTWIARLAARLDVDLQPAAESTIEALWGRTPVLCSWSAYVGLLRSDRRPPSELATIAELAAASVAQSLRDGSAGSDGAAAAGVFGTALPELLERHAADLGLTWALVRIADRLGAALPAWCRDAAEAAERLIVRLTDLAGSPSASLSELRPAVGTLQRFAGDASWLGERARTALAELASGCARDIEAEIGRPPEAREEAPRPFLSRLGALLQFTRGPLGEVDVERCAMRALKLCIAEPGRDAREAAGRVRLCLAAALRRIQDGDPSTLNELADLLVDVLDGSILPPHARREAALACLDLCAALAVPRLEEETTGPMPLLRQLGRPVAEFLLQTVRAADAGKHDVAAHRELARAVTRSVLVGGMEARFLHLPIATFAISPKDGTWDVYLDAVHRRWGASAHSVYLAGLLVAADVHDGRGDVLDQLAQHMVGRLERADPNEAVDFLRLAASSDLPPALRGALDRAASTVSAGSLDGLLDRGADAAMRDGSAATQGAAPGEEHSPHPASEGEGPGPTDHDRRPVSAKGHAPTPAAAAGDRATPGPHSPAADTAAASDERGTQPDPALKRDDAPHLSPSGTTSLDDAAPQATETAPEADDPAPQSISQSDPSNDPHGDAPTASPRPGGGKSDNHERTARTLPADGSRDADSEQITEPVQQQNTCLPPQHRDSKCKVEPSPGTGLPRLHQTARQAEQLTDAFFSTCLRVPLVIGSVATSGV